MMKSLTLGGFVAVAAFSLYACSGGGGPPGEEVARSSEALTSACARGTACSLVLPVPQSSTPQNVIVSAQNGLALDTGSTVMSANGSPSVIANLGGVTTTLGNTVTVGEIVSVPGVNLGTGDVIEGSIITGGIVTNPLGSSVVEGPISSLQTIATSSPVEGTVTFPATSPAALTVSSGTQTLAPGSYGAVTVNAGATLALTAGTYTLTSLSVAAGATLDLTETAGQVVVDIFNGFQFAGTEVQHGGDGQVLISDFNGTIDLITSPFRGTLSVQTGSIQLVSTAPVTYAGGYFGASVHIGANNTVLGLAPAVPPPPAAPPLGGVSAGLDPLPPPPGRPGCYGGTLNGWVAIPCTDPTTVLPGFQSFDVGADGLETVPVGSLPLAYGQVESTVEAFGSEEDFHAVNCKAGSTCADGTACPSNGQCPCNAKTCTSNTCDSAGNCGLGHEWGVQLNSNTFPCPSGFTGSCWAQFVAAAIGDSAESDGGFAGVGVTAVCIETWNGINTSGQSDQNFCVVANGTTQATGSQPVWKVNTRSGPLQNGDFGNVAAYAYTANGAALIGMVAQFSWVANEDLVPTSETDVPNRIPGLYAVVTSDQYGLAQNWTNVSGGLIGMDNSNIAEFKNTEVLTRYAVSDCQGDVSPAGVTCPSQPALSSSNVVAQPQAVTGETNNLTQIESPTVVFPNANLAVTDVFASTNATGVNTAGCLSSAPNHLYIKDTDGDNGGVPSNVGGVPFWESPDIFVLPASSPAPGVNSVSADTELTAGVSYDVYLRVHNEYGCNPVTGPINVFIDGADPNLGLQSWSGVTSGASTGQYFAFGGSGTLVNAFSAAIIGPFPWVPGDGGHKCLLAAIAADGEAKPPTTIAAGQPVLPPAYSSNQIAQRNLQIGSACTYNVTNTGTTTADLLFGISVTGGSVAFGALGGPVVSLVIGDPGGAWAAQWQGSTGLFTVTNDGTNTTVLLDAADVALPSVPLAAGASPSVTINVFQALGTPPTVNVSALLTNPQTGTIILENGGSCTGTANQVAIP